MRSMLQFFRPLLDRNRTDGLVAELALPGRGNGRGRDLEVQEKRIGADVAAPPPEIALGPVKAQITRLFAGCPWGGGRDGVGGPGQRARYLALLVAVDALLA